jgi:hypothetical protein
LVYRKRKRRRLKVKAVEKEVRVMKKALSLQIPELLLLRLLLVSYVRKYLLTYLLMELSPS